VTAARILRHLAEGAGVSPVARRPSRATGRATPSSGSTMTSCRTRWRPRIRRGARAVWPRTDPCAWSSVPRAWFRTT